jgi:hypothetical protein
MAAVCLMFHAHSNYQDYFRGAFSRFANGLVETQINYSRKGYCVLINKCRFHLVGGRISQQRLAATTLSKINFYQILYLPATKFTHTKFCKLQHLSITM